VIVDVSGAGTAHVNGEQAVDVAVTGTGDVHYYGPLRSQRVNRPVLVKYSIHVPQQ
ncbi:unnamed protein product, partial [Adineta steineri]